jgi:ribosomal protein S18 acetylase RimI-like enzyme
MGAEVQYRTAGASDATAVAALHADSWRRHYRGAYSDAFLDGDVATDRLAIWSSRLIERSADHFTIVAEADGELVGFIHTVRDADPVWGALVDNLHVSFLLKRSGIGSRLMGAAARALIDREPSSGLFLWVLEQNLAAQAFYEARGGVRVERALAGAPMGDPANLNGEPFKLRYSWRDPATLALT